MIVRKENLGFLVRTTSINAFRYDKLLNETTYLQRRTLIEEISSKFKKEETVEQFYSSLFNPIANNANVAPNSFVNVSFPQVVSETSSIPVVSPSSRASHNPNWTSSNLNKVPTSRIGSTNLPSSRSPPNLL